VLRKKVASAGITAVLLSSILLWSICLRTAHASGPTLYVYPAENNVKPKQSFIISVNVENVVDLFAYEVKLAFNNAVLEPLAVEEGPFIRDQTTSPHGTFFLSRIEDDFVHVACLTVDNYPGVSGSGVLLRVTFNAIGSGTSDLHLYDTILLDSSITNIAHGTVDGTVLSGIEGDVNRDGIVNVIDLTFVSYSYGAFAGEPYYNLNADLNKDGIVDMRDLSTVAFNLGQTA
jgi:hypothetical protein